MKPNILKYFGLVVLVSTLATSAVYGGEMPGASASKGNRVQCNPTLSDAEAGWHPGMTHKNVAKCAKDCAQAPPGQAARMFGIPAGELIKQKCFHGEPSEGQID